MEEVTGGAMTREEYMSNRCDSCRFFMDLGDGSGTCHRYPPSWHAQRSVAKWPVVNEVDWCGEWCALDMAPA